MRKEQQYSSSASCSVSSSERNSLGAVKRVAKKPRVCQVSAKLKSKLQKVLSRYVNSNAFTEYQINALKFHLFAAAHRTQDQLETELTLNRLEVIDCSHKWELVSRVAHGRTFGKIIKKCPTCRAGSLQLELDEGRYICQFDCLSNKVASMLTLQTMAHGIPTLNCGLAFDFAEIYHINWINHSNTTQQQ